MGWRRGNRLRLVPEAEAPERTRQIYHEIKQALGVPGLPTAFQAYAAYPSYFELHWQGMRPVVATQEFFDLGERLRADAYTRCFNYLEIPDLCASLPPSVGSDSRCELGAAVDFFHYVNPLTLLLVAAQLLVFESAIGERGNPAGRPADHPVYPDLPRALDENAMPAHTRQVLEELKRVSGLPLVTYDYRVLARWPEFLTAYWRALKGVLQSPIYEGCHHGVRETAFVLARDFPQPLDLSLARLTEAGIPDEDLASITRLTETFVDALGHRLLHICIAKIGLEGGTPPQARDSGTAQEGLKPTSPGGGKERAA